MTKKDLLQIRADFLKLATIASPEKRDKSMREWWETNVKQLSVTRILDPKAAAKAPTTQDYIKTTAVQLCIEISRTCVKDGLFSVSLFKSSKGKIALEVDSWVIGR